MTETILCPTCNVEPTDVDGKLVCTECYKVVDRLSGAKPLRSAPAPTPAAAPAPAASAPGATALTDAPLAGGAAPAMPAPVAARPTPVATGPKECPTCKVETTDVDGKMVCTKCYRVIDQPELQIVSNAPSNYKQGIQSFGVVVAIFFVIVLFLLIQWMSHTTPQ